MPYLFVPPRRHEVVTLAGRSLRYSYPVSYTVYKDSNGVWQTLESPSTDVLLAAEVNLGGRPSVISDALAAELILAGVGTCFPIQA